MAGEFQLTDYGPMAGHFASSPLGMLCVDEGGVQTGPFGSQLHQEDYVLVGTPIITVEHLGENRITRSNLPRVSVKDKERLLRYSLQEGDIVFSRVGSVDRRALVRKEEDGWLFSGRCLRVRVDKKRICPQFLSWVFGLEGFKQHIRRVAVGATMPSINTKILSGIPVYYPPLPEQKSIAHILVTLDDKIDLNRRMNATLEAMARSLFQSWFVDFDPVRAKLDGRKPAGIDASTSDLFPAHFQDSILGPIPQEWRVSTLGELAKNVSITFDFTRTSEVIFINTGEVLEGDFLHSTRSVQAGLPGQAKKSIRPDDILFSEIRPENKRFAYVDFDSSDYVVSTKFMVIRASKDIHPRLLYRILTAEETLNEFQVQAESRSGTFPQITFDSISHLPIVLPPMEIQEAYQRAVCDIDAQIKLNKQQSRTLATLRDALLPCLMSGKLSVFNGQLPEEEFV